MIGIGLLISAFGVAFYNRRTNASSAYPTGPILDVFDDIGDID